MINFFSNYELEEFKGLYFEEGVLHICVDNPQLNIYLDVPICDSVMVDILSEQIKKLNKLKLVMESLK